MVELCRTIQLQGHTTWSSPSSRLRTSWSRDLHAVTRREYVTSRSCRQWRDLHRRGTSFPLTLTRHCQVLLAFLPLELSTNTPPSKKKLQRWRSTPCDDPKNSSLPHGLAVSNMIAVHQTVRASERAEIRGKIRPSSPFNVTQ